MQLLSRAAASFIYIIFNMKNYVLFTPHIIICFCDYMRKNKLIVYIRHVNAYSLYNILQDGKETP